MAYDAVGREIGGNVIGIGRPGEVRFVARIAIGRNRLVIAVDVAQRAGHSSVCPSQREYRRVVEGRRVPGRRTVAKSAVRRKSR